MLGSIVAYIRPIAAYRIRKKRYHVEPFFAGPDISGYDRGPT